MTVQSLLTHVRNLVVIASITANDLGHTSLMCEEDIVDLARFVLKPSSIDIGNQLVDRVRIANQKL